MPSTPENPIPGYILRVMEEEDLRPVDVLRNAKRLKIKLSQSSFSEIYSGQTKKPSIFALIDISKALGRPFEEMVAEIQGSGSVNTAEFKESEFAVMFQMYDRLNSKNQKHADRLLEMIKREIAELLKQQGETNLIQLRK